MAARDDLESKWRANERRLNEIAAMTGLGREMHATEIERLKREQDEIECQLGFDLFDEPEGLMCGTWDFDDDDDDDDGFNFDDSDSEP